MEELETTIVEDKIYERMVLEKVVKLRMSQRTISRVQGQVVSK